MLSLIPVAYAANGDWGDCVDKGVATIACLPILFQNVINGALLFSGIVALIFIILSGVKLINSGGDPKQVEGARKTLTWAIIGLIVIMLAFFIINVISKITGVTCILKFGFGNCQ
ncbi:MAG TPA: pilin [Candidatus Saccharimonadales bacterium]|nr:pilin [Candidatus Saccharimonadales bacterium]